MKMPLLYFQMIMHRCLKRTLNAGRITKDMSLTEPQWEVFVQGVESVAKIIKDTFGMRTVFHHHCAGYIETPWEVEKLMALTDPNLVGLCLDMGHYAFGGGIPEKALEAYADRIWHVHFKDYDAQIAQASREANGDYFDAIKRGVFCKLGEGTVDFKTIVNILHKINYNDWIVVEQDVLPGMGHPKACAQFNRNYIKTLGL